MSAELSFSSGPALFFEDLMPHIGDAELMVDELDGSVLTSDSRAWSINK
jgi:hypothetical protein